MLAYPSIPGWKQSKGIGKPCLAFYKYDGSNIRFEWSPKRSWYKFGSRTQLIDRNTEQFKGAIEAFEATMADDIVKMIQKDEGRKVERIVAFAEYFGKSSFAGWHDPAEPKDLVLIDVSVYKQGFMEARRFLNLFGDQPWAAKLIYEGNMNHEFIESVRHGNYPVYEGVVCKGDGWNAKIKTFEYINRLKNRFGDEWEKYGE